MFNHPCTSWGRDIQVANLGTKHLQDLQREHLEMLQECFPERRLQELQGLQELLFGRHRIQQRILKNIEKSHVKHLDIACSMSNSKRWILFLFLPCNDFKVEFIQAPPKQCPPCVKARNIDEHYLLQAWILWKLLEANLKGLQTPATHSYTTLNAHA